MISGDFELFCERNQNSMYHVAFKILRDSLDAEDAVQSTFEKILRRINRIDFETERAEEIYAKRAVKCTSIDMLRQRKQREKESQSSQEPFDDLPFLTVCDEESTKEIRQLLGPKASAIFSYRNIGLSDSEIAAELGVSISDIRTTVYRARSRVSKAMKKKEAGHYGQIG